MNFKLGLDTGGTYTDAVIVDESTKVVAKAKSLTTHQDLSVGLRTAINRVLAQLSVESNGLTSAADVGLVSLSTTLATNALVEGKGRPVALLLIGYTESQFKRAQLPAALGGDPVGFINGGHNAAGEPQQELDEPSLQAFIQQHQQQVEAFAVSSMFAVRNPEHENRARDLIRQLSGMPVSCGHQLSSALDAPRRALTAVLNARLIPLLKNLLDATAATLNEYGISAPLMLVKGDGSLVTTEFAQNSPVETILSGPAASVVGAQFLSGADELIVSDIGGTTTDIAILRNGLPKLDPAGATVGGWRTMVEAVMINTHGLGGDSAVNFNRINRDFELGPQRVQPLSLLIHEHPQLLENLQSQLKRGFAPTHIAQFALCNIEQQQAASASCGAVSRLSGQQQELLRTIAKAPVALLDLFQDQTLDRPLSRLVKRGLVMIAAFTPTDASHILGLQSDWDSQAAHVAARLLMRYSEQNLGGVFDNPQALAEYIVAKLARQTAMALLEATLADQADRPELRLTHDERRFINNTFAPAAHTAVKLNVELGLPVTGIGASATSYYPAVGKLLNVRMELPQHAEVANALGAVVGSVRQSLSQTITPAAGNAVRVHAAEGPREFADLETAASWCIDDLTRRVGKLAAAAGAAKHEYTVDRQDNQVESDGQVVFFESTITVHAVGRPAHGV